MSFRFTSKWKDEEALVPKNVWEDDLDAFTASWENLNEGGHGTWYDGSVGIGYFDELSQAYRDIESSLNIRNRNAVARTSEGEPLEEDHEDDRYREDAGIDENGNITYRTNRRRSLDE